MSSDVLLWCDGRLPSPLRHRRPHTRSTTRWQINGSILLMAPSSSSESKCCSGRFLLLSLVFLLCVWSPLSLVSCQCDGCVDATATVGCPYPELCGFASISCVGCTSVPTSSCPQPSWCVNVTCGSSCMDGMPMPGCLDPGACGFQPTPCKGCVVGTVRPGQFQCT
jgi:hypothetical protein